MQGGPYFTNKFVNGFISRDVRVSRHPRDGECMAPGFGEPGAEELGCLDCHRVAI